MAPVMEGNLNFSAIFHALEASNCKYLLVEQDDWAEHLDRILTMSGEQLLQGNGSISHKQAVDKAMDEYKKYKARTLSTVEEDYLNSIKILEKKTEKEQ